MATFDEIFNGDMPSDVSIDRNVKEAMEYAASHNTFETLAWFYDKVRNGGEWDYKQKDKESAQAENRPNKYEDLGNFNYAVVGKAIGIDDRILKVAAAGAQVAANNTPSVPNYVPDNFKEALKGLLSKGTLGVGSLLDLREGLLTGDFGTYDNNEDQVIIDKGIKAYKDLYGDNANLNMDNFFNTLSDIIRMIDSIFSDINNTFKDFIDIFSDWLNNLTTDTSENYYFKDNNGSNVIFGRNGNDEIQGSGGNDIVYGGSSNDTLYGDNKVQILFAGTPDEILYFDCSHDGNDILYGGDGNDTLYGDHENDILIGGKGDDTLYGEFDDDTYIFNLGDGNDTIAESGGIDSIKFGSNLNADDIKFNQILDDLVIKYSPNDQITITDYFTDGKIENFELEDGSILTSDQINKIIQDFHALNTQNNSEFDGFSFADIQNNSNLQVYG